MEAVLGNGGDRGEGMFTSPVGPAPNINTLDPSRGRILSRPWAAQDAGSIRVASMSLRLWIWKTLACG
jgi:hypothetical protein